MTRNSHPNRKPLDPLVREAQEFINQHSGGVIQGCFHKNRSTGQLESFGVYNTATKKYSIHFTTNFYPDDLLDIKRIVLERKS